MAATALGGIGLTGNYDLGESGWHTSMNANLHKLTTLVQPLVLDKDLATPPVSPTTGASYIVAASPTGAWVGHATHIAVWDGSAWVFYAPNEGWRVHVDDENIAYWFNGSAWVAQPPMRHYNSSGQQITTPLGAMYFSATTDANGQVTVHATTDGTADAAARFSSISSISLQPQGIDTNTFDRNFPGSHTITSGKTIVGQILQGQHLGALGGPTVRLCEDGITVLVRVEGVLA